MRPIEYGQYPAGGKNQNFLKDVKPRIHHVREDIVRELVELIRVEAEYAVCERAKFISEVEYDNIRYRLEMDAMLEYEDEQILHWECPYLLRITPLWKELHVYNVFNEEYPNDFDISFINTLLNV